MENDLTERISPAGSADEEPGLSALSLSELVVMLDALEAKRETLLAERTTMNMPAVYLREGDEMPPWNTIDGKLFRVANLFNRLQYEYVKREVNHSKAEKEAKNETLPTAFDGDPRL